MIVPPFAMRVAASPGGARGARPGTRYVVGRGRDVKRATRWTLVPPTARRSHGSGTGAPRPARRCRLTGPPSPQTIQTNPRATRSRVDVFVDLSGFGVGGGKGV